MTYCQAQDQNVIMVGWWVLQIKFLLLSHLWSYTVVKEIEPCNHRSRHNSQEYKCWRDWKQILQVHQWKMWNSHKNIQCSQNCNSILNFFLNAMAIRSLNHCNKLSNYFCHCPMLERLGFPRKWGEEPPRDPWRDLAWQWIWQCCPQYDHQWNTIVSN